METNTCRSRAGGTATRLVILQECQELMELPPELSFCKNVTLALDIVKANQTPFLMTISLKLQCRACERVIPKGTKEDSFFAATDKALRWCNKGRFEVTEI